MNKKSKAKLRQIEEKILIYLREGYSQKEIGEKLGISQPTVSLKIKRLKEEGKITAEEIKDARSKKKNEEMEKSKGKIGGKVEDEKNEEILRLLREGYLQKEIAEKIGIHQSTVSLKIKRLKEEGRITKKEIEEANKNKAIKGKDKKILKMLREGYSINKIEKELGLYPITILSIIRELVKRGEITADEMIKIKSKKNRRNKNRDNKQEEKWKKYLRNAKKIINLQSKWSNEFFQEFIKLARERQNNGKLKPEELDILGKALLIESANMESIINVARLYLSLKKYRECYVFLNRSKDSVSSEDSEEVIRVIDALKQGIKEHKAVSMLIKGCNIEDIRKETGLRTIDILDLRNKYITNPQRKQQDESELYNIEI